MNWSELNLLKRRLFHATRLLKCFFFFARICVNARAAWAHSHTNTVVLTLARPHLHGSRQIFELKNFLPVCNPFTWNRTRASVKTLCGKLPTYPSPKPTVCPKWEVSDDVDVGEGWSVSQNLNWSNPSLGRKASRGVRRPRREKQNLYSRLSHLGNIHESSLVSLALLSLRRDQWLHVV